MKPIIIGFGAMTALFVRAAFWGLSSTFARVTYLYIFLILVALLIGHYIVDRKDD